MENEKELYYRIDEDDEISDSEKREIYLAELENDKAEQEWEDEQ